MIAVSIFSLLMISLADRRLEAVCTFFIDTILQDECPQTNQDDRMVIYNKDAFAFFHDDTILNVVYRKPRLADYS